MVVIVNSCSTVVSRLSISCLLCFFVDPADKASKGNLRAATPGKGKTNRGKSSKDDKKGKEKDKHEENLDDEEDATPLPPLTIQVHIKLRFWKSAREAAQEFVPHDVPGSHSEQN